MSDFHILSVALHHKKRAMVGAELRLKAAREAVKGAEEELKAAELEYRDAKGDLIEYALEHVRGTQT